MQDRQTQEWWKFGHVWLLIAGPAAVVVAGFFTLFLALRTPDPVVGGYAYRPGSGTSKTLPVKEDASLAPALQARNHAATGAPPPAPRP